ncbi:hypothetical protein MMC30_006589 [Trapelia coarctata]|nr:hypothetical protein [Trapelia coarctata]
MRSTTLLLALLGTALAVPHPQPQFIDVDGVEAAADPVMVTPPMDVVYDEPDSLTTTAVEAVAMATAAPVARRGGVDNVKRDGTCEPQPKGSGPLAYADTPEAFLADTNLQSLALNALAPAGYTQVFQNVQASLSASNYMGLYTIDKYDNALCQSICDQKDGCVAFNLYLERDPTLSANTINCPNPPSTTNIKCTLWGSPISANEAKNTGQYRAKFHVVIAASNGYNKITAPDPEDGYDGPTQLGGAINAPSSSKTYMGYQFFPFSQSQGLDMKSCTDACTKQTGYNSRHPKSDCTYNPCTFVNGYVLSKNGVPQGLYCSMYSQTWDPSYAKNYGQYRGSDHYSVSYSYSYSVQNPVAQPAYGPSCTPA